MHGLDLIIPEKADAEREAVAAAWIAAGGRVTKLGRFWEPPCFDRSKARIYGNDTFALVLAQQLGLELVSPPDDLLMHLPFEWLARNIEIVRLGDIQNLKFPMFAKSVVPKLIRSGVYQSASSLHVECTGLDVNEPIYVCEVVAFQAEARAFILDDNVLDVSLYEGQAELTSAAALIQTIATSKLLPTACVVDVGYIPSRGWVVIEANAAWGAGLNGCSAEKVIKCIAGATRSA